MIPSTFLHLKNLIRPAQIKL